MFFDVDKKYGMKEAINSADGLVGYDTALTRQGSRVQFPLRVVVFFKYSSINYQN